jgi:hypothetical protein
MNGYSIPTSKSGSRASLFARAFAGLGLTMAILSAACFGAAAQDANPPTTDSSLAGLGYPELRLVTTDSGFDSPRTIAAGRYLVTLENQGTAGGPVVVSDVNFLQLPPGVTLDELNLLLTVDGATVPDWYDDIISTGGFSVAAGDTGYGVLDLEPGEWLVGVGDTNPFRPITVAGDPVVTASSDPSADLSIELSESVIALPDQLPAGGQVWHATNGGDQLHEIVLVKTTELLTIEQVVAIIALPEGGTLSAGVPDPATLEFPAAGVKPLSAGRDIWIEMDLAPGYYVAICLIPDRESGAPHAMMGMVDVFTVGDPATPTT